MNGLNYIWSFARSMRTTYLMSQDEVIDGHRQATGLQVTLATAGLGLVRRQNSNVEAEQLRGHWFGPSIQRC